ncbi:MAG: AGE family epimerase/isomerase [Caldilineaceae bacterium]
MSSSLSASLIDFGWFRQHLLNDIFPHWLNAVTSEGLFLSHFDRQWRTIPKNFGTLVSQSRLLYDFAKGYELTQDEQYRRAVEAGAYFLLEKFRDRDYGGWYWSCNRAGEVLDPRKDSYGHAFVIFGLAHACQCTGNQEFKAAALETWEIFQTRFHDEYGGYRWRMTREFQPAEQIKSQNPIMHLFEALLALSDVKDTAYIRKDAEQVANFILTKLVRPSDRRLPEVYSPDWQELPAGPIGPGPVSEGGRLDVGHAFEWSFLLSTAVERGLPAHYLDYATSFINYGMLLGYDAQAGGIYSPADPTGQLLSQRKGWWEQCEAARALMHFVVRRQRDDFRQPLAQTVAFIQKQFVDPVYGGWYMTLEPGGDPTNQDKGTEWKVDYHVVGMCMEGVRLAAEVK